MDLDHREEEKGIADLAHDDTAHQGVYLFTPALEVEDSNPRPKKRRKLPRSNEASPEVDFPYPTLLRGREPVQRSQARQNAYQSNWTDHAKIIDDILNGSDTAIQEGLDAFITGPGPEETDKRIPAALILTRTNTSSQSRLLEMLGKSWFERSIHLLRLDSGQAPNLKIALKAIIRGAIVQVDGIEGYQHFVNDHKKSTPLNYDLELLYEFVRDRGIMKIVLAFTDSEAFDPTLLGELLPVLSAWRDRIPFTILFSIATSVDLFETRLPRTAVRSLYGRRFELESGRNTFEEIFQSLCLSGNAGIWLGRDACRTLLELSKEQLTTPESIAVCIKYSLMSHFFADPFTVLISNPGYAKANDLGYLCEAIRNTESFRILVEEKFATRAAKTVKELLEDDEYLLIEARESVRAGQEMMRSFCPAIEVLHGILTRAGATKSMSFPELYAQAMSGGILKAPFYRDLMLSVQKMSSKEFLDLSRLETDIPALDGAMKKIFNDLRSLLDTAGRGSSVIKSSYELGMASHTTISRNNKISLSSTKKEVSPTQAQYTAIVERYHTILAAFFQTHLVNPNDLFMSEAFIYNGKIPLSTAFSPRPRYAIERSLTSPFDYLGCACCQGIREDEVRATQPPTAILWRLWCEAGALVNVRDLWEAFKGVLGPAEKDSENDPEQQDKGMDITDKDTTERTTLALFYRGMAELRMLGFVKPSRKRLDCVAKTAWKGL